MDNRKIDTAIAEKVMGWKLKSILINTYGNRADVWVNEAEKIMAYCREWKPSTDIAAAWQVEQKIDEAGLYKQYVFALSDVLDLGPQSNPYIVIEKMMKATPKQRCLAALQAVGVEVEGMEQ